MKGALIVIAGLIGWNLVKKTFNPLSKIVASFKGIDSGSINLFNARINVTLGILNSNSFDILINDVKGVLRMGKLEMQVMQQVKFILKPGESVNGKFTIQVDNDEFFLHLSKVVQSKQTPALFFDGVITAGLENGSFSLLLRQQIPIAVL